MKKKLVSIIIPVYNTNINDLKRCLYSLLNQSYIDFEAIIVDDGSTNNIGKTIQEFAKNDSRIKYFYKENTGRSDTRNYGIKESTGDYICFIDSDDEYTANAIEILVKLIESDDYDFARANFAFKSSYSYKKAVCPIIKKIDNNELKNECLKAVIDGKIPTFIWVLILKRNFLSKISGFNKNINFMEDKVFYYEIFSKANKCIIADDIIYNYYFNDFENKDNNYWPIYLKNVNLVFENILEIEKNNNNNELYINYINNNAFLQINFIIYCMYKNNNKIDVKKFFYKCNNEFVENIKNFKNNNIYSKVCIFCINHKYFNLLKLMYRIKSLRGKK